MNPATLRISEDKVWHLKRVPIFDMIPPDELESLCQTAQFISLGPLRYVQPPVAEEPGVWLVKRGHVRLNYIDGEGRSVTVVILHPGDMFGSWSDLPMETFGQQAQAISACCLCRISRRKLNELIQAHPDLGYRFTAASLRQMERIQMRLADVLIRSVDGRLALALLELEAALGRDAEGGGRELQGTFSHRELAEFIGSSREMVTHVLRKFKARGLVDTARQHLVILDRAGLREIGQQ